MAKRGKRNQTIASPTEYAGKSDTAPAIMHHIQNAKPALTQNGLSHAPSPLTTDRMTKVRAKRLIQKSAGDRSIRRIKGPRSQKT
jgi:hypothetical protein